MTGMWSNITDEDIENADNTVQNPNEGDILGSGDMGEETEPAAINDAIPFTDVLDWNEKEHPRRNNGQFGKGDYGTNVKVDNKDIKSYTELFKGMKTSNGIVIKSVTGHGTGRMIERGISPDIVHEVLKVKPIPGNKPHTWQFDKEHYRIIFGNDGNIITAINRRRKSGKTTTKASRHNNE